MAWYVWLYIIVALCYFVLAIRTVTAEGDGKTEHPGAELLACLVTSAVWPLSVLHGIGVYWGKRGEK